MARILSVPRPLISFTELMEVLLQGNMKEALNTAGKMLQSALFSQAKEGQILLVQVALLGLTGAVFSHAASAFKGSQIPETAFYVIYLLIFTCLAGSTYPASRSQPRS